MPVPGIEPGLPTMSLLKYQNKIPTGFELRLPALELRTLPLDHQRQMIINSSKLYLEKSPVKEQTLVVQNGTNIFLVGLYFYFLNFICGIWSWGVASSFWNHVIQISIRQVHFQDISSQLWIVKIFSENIYFL